MAVEELDLGDIAHEDDLAGIEQVEDGIYHWGISKQERSEKDDATILTLTALAGTVAGQEGRTMKLYLNDGASHRDGGVFARKRKAKVALVSGLIQPSDLGKPITIDWSKIVGRQFIAQSTKKKGDNGKVFPEIEGLGFYRVTDPEMAHVPKSEKGLRMLGIDPASLAAAPPPAQKSATPPAKPAVPPPPAAAAPADPWKNL